MPPKGQHLSLEAREKIRQARLGTHHTEEWKIKHSQQMSGPGHPWYGKHLPEETKEKIRQANIGKTYSEETKEKHRQLMLGENNPMYGRHHSEDAKQKIRQNKSVIIGYKNPQWKGDDVGYSALHDWVRRCKPKPDLCSVCKLVPPEDMANISGEYKRDINDFVWMCRKCHYRFDHS